MGATMGDGLLVIDLNAGTFVRMRSKPPAGNEAAAGSLAA
jgi:hypothetical protein